ATQLPHNPRLNLRVSERRLSWRITAMSEKLRELNEVNKCVRVRSRAAGSGSHRRCSIDRRTRPNLRESLLQRPSTRGQSRLIHKIGCKQTSAASSLRAAATDNDSKVHRRSRLVQLHAVPPRQELLRELRVPFHLHTRDQRPTQPFRTPAKRGLIKATPCVD